MAELHAVDGGILARDVNRDGIDVGRDAFRPGPQRQRSESEQSRASSNVGNVCESTTVASEEIERG